MSKQSAVQAVSHEAVPGYTGRELAVVMVALMLVMLLAALDQTIVSTALPRIATDLHGLSKLSWVATAYLLTSAITTPIYGKISDLFGRKRVFQIAIGTFLIGSVLCGVAQSMDQLVLARGLQGIGAGGLMALVMAIIGDIIPPRQRGKYMGYFGAVFGISSVAGPLLGGFLTESLSWRWVFFVNIPLGALGMWAVASKLHLPKMHRDHHIDYLGAGLLAAGSVCLLLASVWGGTMYEWASTQIISLLVSGGVLAALFVWWEQRAQEPIIPMRLFRNKIFSVSVMLSMLAGIAMFAAILYIPLYQQVVRGYSPTKSGLMMLPLVLGLLLSAVLSGRWITKTGKYKIFPLIGNLVLAFGLWLFSHISLATNEAILGVWMFVIGAGIGLFMQVTTLAIQNSVERQDIGTATSGVTFFRNIGSTLGGAIFGAILTNRLTHHLTEAFPNGFQGSKIDISNIENGTNLHALPPDVAHNVFQAFVQSFHEMFLIAIPITVLAFVVALFLEEAPLRSTHEPHEPAKQAPILE